VLVFLLFPAYAFSDYRWFEDTAPGLAEPLADPWAARFITSFQGSPSGARLYRMGLGTGVGFLQPVDQSWSLEGRAGIFSRFDFLSSSFDLQTADFIGGLAWRKVWGPGQLEVYGFHQSAHAGGDFMQEQNFPSVNVSRETLRVLYSYQWAGITAYGGPRGIVHSDPGSQAGKVGIQAGCEFHYQRFTAGLDVQMRGEYGWDTDIRGCAGVSLSPGSARWQQVFQVFASSGHATAGQLEGRFETCIGLGMVVLDQGGGFK
jgi:urease beta subunit